jgi:hypothetical protein
VPLPNRGGFAALALLLLSASLVPSRSLAEECGHTLCPTGTLYTTRPDGNGGAYVLFDSDAIRILRLDSSGVPAPSWSTCGLALGPSTQQGADIAPDGEGGSFVTWAVDRSVFLNRIGPDGLPVPGWPAGGALVRYADSSWTVEVPRVAVDGAGGAYVAYVHSHREYLFYDAYVYLAHVGPTGAVDSDTSLVYVDFPPVLWLVPDGSHGAWLISNDHTQFRRHASGAIEGPAAIPFSLTMKTVLGEAAGGWTVAGGYTAISATRMGADGNYLPEWAPRVIDPGPSAENNPCFALDGAGGLLIAWTDGRNSPPTAYATHLDADGSVHPGWDPQGTRLSDEIWSQASVAISSDGAAGAFVTWLAQGRLWAQHVESDGRISPVFGPYGPRICITSGDLNVSMVPAATGSALLVWSDDLGLHSTSIQSDGVVAANVSLAGVDASWRNVRLRWWVPTGDAGVLAVERLDPGAVWTRRGIASNAGDGLVAFEDTNVQPGVRYGYRLRSSIDGPDLTASETWVDVPDRPRLSLEIANPITTDRASATVTLPGASGTLELFDPMGRRIERIAVSPSESAQRVELASSLRGAGVYLVRLTDSAGGSVTKRFVSIR